MKKTGLFIMLLMAAAFQSSATVIKGQLVSNGGKLPATVSIIRYYPSDQPLIDTVGPYGDFKFELSPSSAALYRIQIGHSVNDVMINPAEPVIRLTATFNRNGPPKLVIDDSFENDAHETLKNAVSLFNDSLSALIKNKATDKMLAELIDSNNMYLTRFAAKHANTYTGTSIAPKLKVSSNRAPTVLESLKQTYLANFNLADADILFTPYFSEYLFFYVRYISDTTETGRSNFISNLFTEAKRNPVVFEALHKSMFTTLHRSNNEKMLLSYLQWINAHPGDSIPPVTKKKIERLSRVLPGKQLTEVSAANTAGQTEKLSETAAKNKYTLLVVWESECSHCRETLPEIKKVYDEYHGKGFEVFAASMDKDPEAWKKYLAEQKITWRNVRLDPANPHTLDDYYITVTPTMVLINSAGVIEHRLMDLPLLKSTLAEKLK